MDRIIEKKKWTPLRILLITGAIVIPLIVIATAYIKTANGSSLNIDRAKISIGEVISGDFRESIPLDGTVLPIRSIYLDAVEAGRIEKRFVEEGQVVEEGQPLLQLSNPQLQLDVMNREELLSNERTNLQNAAYNKDKSLLTLSEQLEEVEYSLARAARTWKQDSLLYASRAVSATEYKNAQDEYIHLLSKKKLLQEKYLKELANSNAQLRQYEAAVQLKARNLSIVKGTLDMLVLRAPARGQLTAFRGEVGEYKNKGQNLGQLDILDGYKVRASIDEHYISRVAAEQTAEFDFAGKLYPLTIKVIYPQVSNGKFEADLVFGNSFPEGIKKGQSLQLRLQLGSNTQAVLVPRGAFYQSSGGNWAYVLSKDGTGAEKRSVKLGRQNPNYFEVLEGLQPGDKIILSSYETYGGHQRLRF